MLLRVVLKGQAHDIRTGFNALDAGNFFSQILHSYLQGGCIWGLLVASSRPWVASSRPWVASSRPWVANSRPWVASSRR